MQKILRRDLAVSKRRQVKLSLVYFDVDKFKDINDVLGHIKGDEVLRNIGKAVLNNVRSTDAPCRYGGDEFCIILPECGANDAKDICEKIINEFGERYPDYFLSIGIAETGLDEYIEGDELVIIPFLTDAKSRGYAAASIRFGGKPPFALLGRSLL